MAENLTEWVDPNPSGSGIPEWGLDVAAAAQELIDQYGDPVTFSRLTAGVTDPVTRVTDYLPPETWTVNAYIRDYTDQEINGRTILAGDQELLLVGDSRFVEGMSVVVLGRTLTVKSLKRKGSGVYFTMRVNR